MKEAFWFVSGHWLRVENTDRCSNFFLGTREELSVRLERVHGDDEVDSVGREVDVLNADEGLTFLRLPNDGVEVLRFLDGGHCSVDSLLVSVCLFTKAHKEVSNFL